MNKSMLAHYGGVLALLLQINVSYGESNPPKTNESENQQALESFKERLTGENAESILFFSQADRRIAFRNIDKIYPTRTIKAGTSSAYPLEPLPTDFSGVSYQVDGKSYTLPEFLAMPSQVGLIVVKDGKVLFEHYAEGNDESTPWISFSVSKSVTSMLIGAAIQDGYIENVEEPISNYLPRLRGTPYEQSTIKNVLHMASGVAWSEDYNDVDSDVAKSGGANGLELVKYLAKLPKNTDAGTTFNYNTGETNLVGEILRSAIGNNASTYLSHKIWQPFGMESDATWVLGKAGGGELGGCCISATLRDYARLGMFAMNGGVLPDGTIVLPPDWMKASTAPSKQKSGYGYLWWLWGDDSFSAEGIFGQQIYIAPDDHLVIASHGNTPTACSEYGRHLHAVNRAIRQAVSDK